MSTYPQVLFVSWQSPENRAIYPIARLLLRSEAPRYEFTYVRGVIDAQQHGFAPFRELPDPNGLYLFDALPPLFTNRLMPRTRPDFADHLTRLGLAGFAASIPEPELILARSEARKATDMLEVSAPPEFDGVTKTWCYYGFARGVRHIDGAEAAITPLRPGDTLRIEADVANAWDARALFVLRTDMGRLGYVPHILVEDLGDLRDRGIEVSAHVIRVNPPPAPVHQRLLIVFRAAHATGFAPMSTSRFQPMAQDATQLDLGRVADLHPA